MNGAMFTMVAVDDLELVLNSRPFGKLNRDCPKIGPFEVLQWLGGVEARDPATKIHGIAGTTIDKGHVRAVNQRKR